MSRGKKGIAELLGVVFVGAYTYRYTLYDENGNKIDEKAAIKVRESSGEWVYDDDLETLKYNKDFLLFGTGGGFENTYDGSSNPYIGHFRVEVDLGEGFEYVGACSLGSDKAVEAGGSLRLGKNSDITMDYTAGSDDPGNGPTNMQAVWRAIKEPEVLFGFFLDDLLEPWHFELRNDNGSVHDTVTISGDDAEWVLDSGDGLKYTGRSFTWNVVPGDFTFGSMHVYAGEDQLFHFAEIDNPTLNGISDWSSSSKKRIEITSGDIKMKIP